jgi:hypothetical protein
LGSRSPAVPEGLVEQAGMTTGEIEQQVRSEDAGQKEMPKVQPDRQPRKSADRMLACRFELKYLITESEAAAIERYIRPFLPLDKYSKLQRGRQYPIVSLYLDSPDLQLCRESLTGLKNRFKLRVRSYTDEPEYPRFFEIKRRINRVIIKSRGRVMDRDVSILLARRSLPPQGYTTDDAALRQFQFYMAGICAGPAILIRYMREAYESTSENRVRVTFDRALCYKVTHEPLVRLGGSGWQRNLLTEGNVILEIKFTGSYPAWLIRLVRDFGLDARSISKFATSIEQSCSLGFCGPCMRSPWHG